MERWSANMQTESKYLWKERANQALTKLNNYAVTHSNLIDASWVVKVIEEVRYELEGAESPRQPLADLDLTPEMIAWLNETEIGKSPYAGTLTQKLWLKLREANCELREAGPWQPSADLLLNRMQEIFERTAPDGDMADFAVHQFVELTLREVSQHPVPAPDTPELTIEQSELWRDKLHTAICCGLEELRLRVGEVATLCWFQEGYRAAIKQMESMDADEVIALRQDKPTPTGYELPVGSEVKPGQ